MLTNQDLKQIILDQAEKHTDTLIAREIFKEVDDLRHNTFAANKEARQRLSQGLSDSETARKTAEHRSAELRLELDRSHQKSDQLQNSFMELAGKLESIQLQLQEKHTQKKRVDRNNLAEEVRSE